MQALKFSLLPEEVKSVIRNWLSEEKKYTWESRAVFPVQFSFPYLALSFVIDVNGFFLDDVAKNPIKLHSEYTFSLDSGLLQKKPNNVSFHLSSELKKFTASAYDSFKDSLNKEGEQAPIYTSDPLYWKMI